MSEIIPTNEFQTKITQELLDKYPDEVQEGSDYTVYRHISPCGRVYVGITRLRLYYRWKHCGIGYKRCKLFYRAIQKYGWDNFIHEIVLSGISKTEAIYTEKYLVKWYKIHGLSYNITDGGEGTVGFHMPDTAKARISERLKDIRCRSVLQYSIDGEFIAEYKSARYAAEILGFGRNSVSNCASGRARENLLHGFIFIYKDNIESLAARVKLCGDHWRKYKIIQYYNGMPINTFESIREAERVTGINHLCISRNIRGLSKIAGGYTWRKVA